MTRLFIILMSTLLAGSGLGASPQVFVQRGNDGAPVRWQKKKVVLSVSQPQPNDAHISRVKLVRYTNEAVLVFKNKFGLAFEVVPAEGLIPRTQEDGINEVAFRQFPPCASGVSPKAEICDDENRFGHTRLYPSRTTDEQGYRAIVEADIELNAAAFNGLSSPHLEDKIIAVLRHEIGHLLGLAHNCAASSWHQQQYRGPHKPPVCKKNNRSLLNELMYPLLLDKDKNQTKPSPGEIQMLEHMYPIKSVESAQPKQPSKNTAHWWIVAALALVLVIGVTIRRLR